MNTLLPVTFFLKDRAIGVRGLVLYAFSNTAGPMKEAGMGMRFCEISPEDLRLVQEFIKDELMRDLVRRDRHKWQHGSGA